LSSPKARPLVLRRTYKGIPPENPDFPEDSKKPNKGLDENKTIINNIFIDLILLFEKHIILLREHRKQRTVSPDNHRSLSLL